MRLNRRRLKGDTGNEDAATALCVLHGVLLGLARLMAPFTPFLSELMYQHLRLYMPACTTGTLAAAGPADGATRAVGPAASVHYTPMPEPDEARVDAALEARVDRMQVAIELGRVARERRHVSLKTPVRRVVLVHADAGAQAGLADLQEYVADELNALEVEVSGDEAAWCTYVALPDNQGLGKRLGADFKRLLPLIKALGHAEIRGFMETGSIVVGGVTLSGSDLKVRYGRRGRARAHALITP